MPIRLPAEWEPQDGILISWPHPETDWAESLDQVEPVFGSMAAAISRFEQVLIIAPDISGIANKLVAAGSDMTNIRLHALDTNDTWVRDYGPITVYDQVTACPLDFRFNGWGGKFKSDLDNQSTAELDKTGVFRNRSKSIGMVLEGGSIDSDGNGTLLTTSRCLLNPNRNPEMSRAEIERLLTNEFGCRQILWLDSGFLQGDDTDAHIDILARFAPNETILYVSCNDEKDVHYSALQKMQEELKAFRTPNGTPYTLRPLPMPDPKFDDQGNRLAATYANFLVINGAVLVPVYDDRNDARACEIIAMAYPERDIIPINSLPLIQQGGSLHCSTMQLPEGVLS